MKSKVVQFDYTRYAPMCAKIGGVQLWENGPYWAECNIGATKPEEPGYYFWWGDTVGYKPEGGTINTYGEHEDVTWVSVKDGTAFEFKDVNYPTYKKDDSQLLAAGYIDSTGNLAVAHDAAAMHWSDGWRMPTAADFGKMRKMCQLLWTTCNGVKGCLVTGKGAYASKSIFLPAAGSSYYTSLIDFGATGSCWSSSVGWNVYDARFRYFDSDEFNMPPEGGRNCLMPVRPLRRFAK